MADDRVLSRIVTKFFVDTCELRQQLLDYDYAWFAAARLLDGRECHQRDLFIPLITGSVAEFYIQPMFQCVGDVDIMFHANVNLAIPAGTAPPTQLPAEFHSRVNVCEILDSEFPGYVYLVSSYLLTECSEDGKYNAVQCPHVYASFCSARIVAAFAGDKLHGPAIMDHVTPQHDRPYSIDKSVFSTDSVPCVRCLSWPSQAVDWSSRPREHGWPDSATVDYVISNGCDVVNVAHRLCKQDEWMSNFQWRLSFSRSEIVLLNSWMPVQQIIYHMLRVFVKTERLTDSADNAGGYAFTNYHIKTLMLWACELKPRSW